MSAALTLKPDSSVRIRLGVERLEFCLGGDGDLSLPRAATSVALGGTEVVRFVQGGVDRVEVGTGLRGPAGAGAVPEGLALSYDSLGRLVTLTRTDDGTTRTATYDALDRVDKVADTRHGTTEAAGYDVDGKLISVVVS